MVLRQPHCTVKLTPLSVGAFPELTESVERGGKNTKACTPYQMWTYIPPTKSRQINIVYCLCKIFESRNFIDHRKLPNRAKCEAIKKHTQPTKSHNRHQSVST